MGEDEPQVWIEWTDWNQAEHTAAIHLLPHLGAVPGWWFIRKRPCWRLRYQDGPGARALLDRMLEHLHRSGHVRSWNHGIYEPETFAFGGRASMALAHQHFHQDSHHILTHATTPVLGRRELALLTASVFLRAAGLDWYEQGDVWARVADLRSHPDPLLENPALARQVHTLLRANAHRLTDGGSPLDRYQEWIRETAGTGRALAGLYRDGLLTRGLRAVASHHLIFSFNRMGVPGRDQQILSTTARKVIMTTTTPAPQPWAKAREQFVDSLLQSGHIRSPEVEEAFRVVPRHVFVPNSSLEEAYSDTVVSVKDDADGRSLSCASAPRIVAMMLEQASIRPGMRVLELGTGTGYNAALLGHMVGPAGAVTTVDVDQDLTDNARERLDEVDVGNVQVVLGDGALGYDANAPYDLVIATVGSHRVPAAWVEQLVPTGHLVAPVRIAGDVSRSIVFTRQGDHWTSVHAEMSTFMPLRDSVGDDTRAYTYPDAENGVQLQVNREQDISADQVEGILNEPPVTVWSGVQIGGLEPRDDLWLKLAIELDNSLSRMTTPRPAIDTGLVHPGLPWGDMASTPTGGKRGLAYLTARAVPDAKNMWELGAIGHAEAGHRLAEHMVGLTRTWDRALKPRFELHHSDEGTELNTRWA